MKNRKTLMIVVGLLLVVGVGTYLVLTRDSTPVTVVGDGSVEPSESLLDAREALLASAQDVSLDLSVDIPKGSEEDNPDHQEITAEGTVDLSAGNAELVYDYQGLANSAGFLGHFDTMDVLYADGSGFLNVFVQGPPWLSFDPEVASTEQIDRLRDVLLTTPMILPGLLESAAVSPAAGDDLSREIDPATLTESEDQIAAGVGEAFQELDVDSILVDVGLDDDEVSTLAITFDYVTLNGKIKVEASWELEPTEDEVTVETPADSDVRTFKSIFG